MFGSHRSLQFYVFDLKTLSRNVILITFDLELRSFYVLPIRDGIPPYRYRKPHRREIHESAKVNGRVPLPHIPVSMLWISRTPCWLYNAFSGFTFSFPPPPPILFYSLRLVSVHHLTVFPRRSRSLSFLPPALSLPSALKWMCILKMHSGGWGALIMCRRIADGEWASARVLSKAFLMLSSALPALPQQMWSLPSDASAFPLHQLPHNWSLWERAQFNRANIHFPSPGPFTQPIETENWMLRIQRVTYGSCCGVLFFPTRTWTAEVQTFPTKIAFTEVWFLLVLFCLTIYLCSCRSKHFSYIFNALKLIFFY